MPKTKKTKQNIFLSKLSTISKRNKFILVVIIFAALGGGYLTYKSFASTGYTMASASGNQIASYGNGSATDYCGTSYSQDAGKNGAIVFGVLCKPVPESVWDRTSTEFGLRWARGGVVRGVTGNYSGKNVRLCTLVKATTTNTTLVIVIDYPFEGSPVNYITDYVKQTVVIPTDRYVSVCSDWHKVYAYTSNPKWNVEGRVLLQTKNNAPTGVFISSITLESDTPLTTTTTGK